MPDYDKFARTLLGRMRIEEKVAQLISVWLELDTNGGFRAKNLRGFEVQDSNRETWSLLRNGIGQITRPLGTHPIAPQEAIRTLNAIQKYLVNETRLGIPALPHEECLAGVMAEGATLFPAGINYGAMWDDGLMQSIADAIGEELVSAGSRQGLAPVLDVSRDARWGRTEETFGEDPYLAGCLAVAYVKGLQGPQRRVLATLKHFVGHSFSEGGRNHAPVHVGERELNDVFLLPFEMAVKLADVGSVMPAYHDIDGEPLTSSRRYLTEVLRKSWGFDGIVVSDYEAISLLYEHHKVASDTSEAAALTIEAGMDMELPTQTCFLEGIPRAIEKGLLSINAVDAAVLRVLKEKFRLGLFDHPFADPESISFNSEGHRAVARAAAAKSITLLTNDGLLPLSPNKRTALIGPLADNPKAMLCGYSFPVHVASFKENSSSGEGLRKTFLSALRERIGEDLFTYSPGCAVIEERSGKHAVFPGEIDIPEKQQIDIVSYDRSMIPAAVQAAHDAEQIVVAVGDIAGLFLSGTVGEGSDVSTLRLPGVQQELLDELIATGKPMVIVLINGRPYNLHKAYSAANAVLEAWLPGQEGAAAIVDILFGDEEPGGRLPISVPKSAGAMPYYYNHKLKSAGTPVQGQFGAVFPFGHGLGYTSFEYSNFKLESNEIASDGTVEISGRVRNSGARVGDEVLQVYVHDRVARLVRPLRELKGYRRMTIPAGKAAEVHVSLPVDLLSYTIAGTDRLVEPGEFEIMVGSSSTDIRFRAVVNVAGGERLLGTKWRMQSTVEYRIVG